MANLAASEVISWGLEGVTVRYTDVLSLLKKWDLPTKVARSMRHADAFRRVLRKMAKEQLVRCTSEDRKSVTFQVNHILENDHLADYPYFASLSLDKATGKVVCLPAHDGLVPTGGEEMAALVEKQVAEKAELRETRDITRLVQRLCRGGADLFPVTKHGGTYLACPTGREFLDKIDGFLADLVGRGLNRIPLAASAAESSGVRRAIIDGLDETVQEYEEVVKSISAKTRQSTLEKNVERLSIVRLKLDGYREVLKDSYRSLVERVTALNGSLEAAIAAYATVEGSEESAPQASESTADATDATDAHAGEPVLV